MFNNIDAILAGAGITADIIRIDDRTPPPGGAAGGQQNADRYEQNRRDAERQHDADCASQSQRYDAYEAARGQCLAQSQRDYNDARSNAPADAGDGWWRAYNQGIGNQGSDYPPASQWSGGQSKKTEGLLNLKCMDDQGYNGYGVPAKPDATCKVKGH